LQLQLITAQINYLHVEISSVKINHFSWQTPVEYTIIPGRSSDCLLDSIYRLILWLFCYANSLFTLDFEYHATICTESPD